MFGYGWSGMLIGGLMMLLFWGGLIALIVMTVRATTSSKSSNATSPSNNETPLEILKKRYAQGDISKEEYEEMRHDIEK
jgi:putative membrane protein